MQDPCHALPGSRFRGCTSFALVPRTNLERRTRRDASPRSATVSRMARIRALAAGSPRPYAILHPLPAIPVPMAFDPRLIDDLARRLAGSVPESVMALRRDLEQNFKGVLQSQLAQFDLVTREEFDVQATVLKRTREKLAALEARLAELEKQR